MFTNSTRHPSTTILEVEFLFIHTMVTPVFITQIEEEEETILSEQINFLNLKDTTSMSIATMNTYYAAEMTHPTMMASTKDKDDDVFPQAVYSTAIIGTTTAIRDSGTPLLNPVVHMKLLDINDYRAKQYYETSCKINPKFLLAMAHDIINPKTGFPLSTLDGEPFCYFHKKNDYKVGNTHLISEITRRVLSYPNWVGVRSGNNDQPQPKSWIKSKCLM